MFVTKSTKIVKVCLILMLFSVFGASTVSAANGLFAKIKKDGKWYAGLEVNQTMSKVGEEQPGVGPHGSEFTFNTLSEKSDMGFGVNAGIAIPHSALFSKEGAVAPKGFFSHIVYDLGVEYQMFGDQKLDNGIKFGEGQPLTGSHKISLSAFYIDLMPHYYFTKNVSVFAGAGLGMGMASSSAYQMQTTAQGTPVAGSASTSGFAYKMALGGAYQFSTIPLSVQLAYSYNALTDAIKYSFVDSSTNGGNQPMLDVSTKPIHINVLMLGVRYYF